MNQTVRAGLFLLSVSFLAACSGSAESTSTLGFTIKSKDLFESPALWLWHYDGSIDALRRAHNLSQEEMYYVAYKFAEIGNYRRYEEALLYVINNTDSLISQLSARALLEYWQTMRSWDQITRYGPDWQQRFEGSLFQLTLAEAFYWRNANIQAWELFEKLRQQPKVELTDEHLLFRMVLALRLGKVVEAKTLYREFVTQLPASNLHERLVTYLGNASEEADLLDPNELAWLTFKNQVIKGQRTEALTTLEYIMQGDYKDWLLSPGLAGDFGGVYPDKQNVGRGLVFLNQYFGDSSSPFVAQAKASLYGKEEAWTLAAGEYRVGLVGARDLPLERTVSYYIAYLRALTYLSIEDFLNGVREVPEDFLATGRFSRLFDIYLNEIIERRDWEGVYALYLGTNGYLAPSYESRMAFLMARLIHHKLVVIVGDPAQQKEYFYDLAMSSDPLSYGSFMAHYFSGTKIKGMLPLKEKVEEWQADKEVNRVLEGFLTFGLARDGYRFQRDHAQVISPQNYLRLARLLGYQEQWFNSIEVMTRLAARKDWRMSEEELKAFYPTPYAASIRYWANNYDVSFPVRMGQIHDESRFDSRVTSHRDAIGISQLLEGTAANIARELNVYRYSITNPEDNIRFGTHYLAKRFTQYGSGFKALMAYNAGYFRLDEWEETLSDLPDELYVEAVPFWETRRYVRSILLNASVYALLYGREADFAEKVVNRIFEFEG